MKFLNRLERKFGRYAIPNLTLYLIIGYAVGYAISFVNPNLLAWLTLDPIFIFKAGQIWRLISWVLIPPSDSIIFAVIMMLLYYNLGSALERTWGTFRYNVYIFGGIIFTILGSFVLYAATGTFLGGTFSTYYINLSIFLAFATCYPDVEVRLYFLIPIKMKWMALVYAALAVYSAVKYGWVSRVAIIASLLNFIIFFLATRNYKAYSPKQRRRRQAFRQAASAGGPGYKNTVTGVITKHKCAICGRTELDDPNLEFRFCSKCAGNYEYCQDHLFTHEHRK